MATTEPPEKTAPDRSRGRAKTRMTILAVAASLAATGYVFWRRPATHRPGETAADTATPAVWSDAKSPIPVTSDDPAWGSRTAPVTLVVFADLECPFSARVAPTLEALKAAYGKDTLRIVWKNAPFDKHANAQDAAEAAQIVFSLRGSDAFWTFESAAFENQSDLGPSAYERWAIAAGVDASAYARAQAQKEGERKVLEDLKLATKVGVKGTPSFRINGVTLEGAQPLSKFRAVIDQELEKARAKIAAGVPTEMLYVEMTKENMPPATVDGDGVVDEDGANQKFASDEAFLVPVGSSPTLGKPDAPVTMVMFANFDSHEVLGVEKVHTVMGISMGGMQAFEWGVSHPDEVGRMVSIVGTPQLTAQDLLLWNAELHVLQGSSEYARGEYGDPRPRIPALQELHWLMLTTPEHRNAETSREGFAPWVASLRDDTSFDWNDWHRQLEAMIAHDVARSSGGDLEAAARRVTAKTLVIVAEHDHMVNPAPSKVFAKAMNASLVVLDTPCGHMAPACDPTIAKTIRTFLEQ